MAGGGVAAAAAWARESERGRAMSANGRGGSGGRGGAHLGADQGASKSADEHHAAARRGHRRARGRGRGDEGRRARKLGRLRPAGQKRGSGLLAPLPPLPFLKKFFF